MSAVTVDVPSHLEQQRLTWDSVSRAWQRWQPTFERGAGVVTHRLLELAGPVDGKALLDVGSGVGEPALSAALAVKGGSVVGVDVAPAMVALARAAGAGHENLTFLEGDIESMGFAAASFDGVVSRWSLAFAADQGAMLRELGRLLRPGGVLAASVWGEPQHAPAISLAFKVISRELQLTPPPPGPGPFAMADAQALSTLLTECGFRDVEITDLTVPFTFASLDEFAQFSKDVLPPGMRQLLRDRVGAVDAPRIWEAFREAASSFEQTADGLLVPSVTRCVRAVLSP
ncbi:MAG: class I SAM-dependent methyltransferase [Pseudomonadota bacterium]